MFLENIIIIKHFVEDANSRSGHSHQDSGSGKYPWLMNHPTGTSQTTS